MITLKDAGIAGVLGLVGGLAIVSLTGCGTAETQAEQAEPAKPAISTVDAKNIQETRVGDSPVRIYIFDVERDGKTLTCSTKFDPTAGVSCIPKP